MAIEAGHQLLHYRLIEQIGEGGMGTVWKAEDTRLHRHVALKLVSEEKQCDSDLVDRHLREARAASALNHPNICSIYDIGESDRRRFIVMELLEGESLQQLIGGNPIELDTAVEYAIQVTEALDAAHRKGIIHRDIKSTNIFVTDHGQAKLLDFGLAKLAAGTPDAGGEIPTALAMTAPGAVVGTIAFMSPEQALGKELDVRTDIFSLGVVLYEMVTGERAFAGSTSAAVFDAILNREPTAPASLNPKVPEELERIIKKTLEKDPAMRYQSAAGLLADLKRLARDSSPKVHPAQTAPRKYWSGWILGAVTLFAAAAILSWQIMDSNESGNPGETESVSKGPSIAVLPFENASGDPNQDYFSDGLAAEIGTELSRYRELSVISRSSTALYGDQEIDVREVGEKLGARYLLQGSVRKVGARIRIIVQLIDTVDGRSVWNDRFERDLTAQDLFDLQDELTQYVVQAIAGSYGALTRVGLPGARRKPPASMDGYDCVLRVYEYVQVHTPENHLGARECLETVLATDHGFADGHAWLGYLYGEQYHHRWNEEVEQYDSLERAMEYADKAMRLDPTSHVVHGAMALVLYFTGDYERAKRESIRTIELNPNDALWLSLMGLYLIQQEDFEQGMPLFLRAIEVNPHPPPWSSMGRFYAHYRFGRYEQALAEAESIQMSGDFRTPLFVAASLGQLGRVEDARPYLEEMMQYWGRPAEEIRSELIQRHALSQGLVNHLMDGLVKAGLE
ncbi:MAG: protein kinase [Acidobacteriota bacterium]|nr:MAG: protein kinase [Acidobacteriota bacterium]